LEFDVFNLKKTLCAPKISPGVLSYSVRVVHVCETETVEITQSREVCNRERNWLNVYHWTNIQGL